MILNQVLFRQKDLLCFRQHPLKWHIVQSLHVNDILHKKLFRQHNLRQLLLMNVVIQQIQKLFELDNRHYGMLGKLHYHLHHQYHRYHRYHQHHQHRQVR